MASSDAAAAAVATASDKEFAKEHYRNLVAKESALLLERRERKQQLAGEQLPCLALTPTYTYIYRTYIHDKHSPQGGACFPSGFFKYGMSTSHALRYLPVPAHYGP